MDVSIKIRNFNVHSLSNNANINFGPPIKIVILPLRKLLAVIISLVTTVHSLVSNGMFLHVVMMNNPRNLRVHKAC